MLPIKQYSNFVRPASPSESGTYCTQPTINGEEARKLYLEEVRDVKDPVPTSSDDYPANKNKMCILKRTLDDRELTDKDLFLSAQNNDVDTLRRALDNAPDKVNILDDYGWSLLMIACQANSIEAVKELLKRDIDTSIRDKANNSAQSLVIKNKNLVLASLLIDHRDYKSIEVKNQNKHKKVKLKQQFSCEICNNTFNDKQEHLSSTLHNFNASKGRKIPSNYIIPESNRGYQLMLKVGWDKESGLGPDGSGKKYPIKTVQKKDRKGLGHDKKKEKPKQGIVKHENKKTNRINHQDNRRVEINFRREFY